MAEGANFSGSRRASAGKLDEGGAGGRDAGEFPGDNRAGGEPGSRGISKNIKFGKDYQT